MFRRLRSIPNALILLIFCVVVSGCVKRVLHIRSEPPGATVVIDGEDIGTTPVHHEFSFYGTVAVVFRHDGFLSRSVEKELDPPWFEFFPLDFVTEFLVPWPVRDEHHLEATLEPAAETIDREAREALRKSAARASQQAGKE